MPNDETPLSPPLLLVRLPLDSPIRARISPKVWLALAAILGVTKSYMGLVHDSSAPDSQPRLLDVGAGTKLALVTVACGLHALSTSDWIDLKLNQS